MMHPLFYIHGCTSLQNYFLDVHYATPFSVLRLNQGGHVIFAKVIVYVTNKNL